MPWSEQFHPRHSPSTSDSLTPNEVRIQAHRLALVLAVVLSVSALAANRSSAQVAVRSGFNPLKGQLSQTTSAFNPFSGRIGTSSGYINPFTGGVGRAGAVANMFNGNVVRRFKQFNPFTGRTTTGGAAYNRFTGQYRWAVNQR